MSISDYLNFFKIIYVNSFFHKEFIYFYATCLPIKENILLTIIEWNKSKSMAKGLVAGEEVGKMF